MVKRLILYHNESKFKNSGVCPMGKIHNILYVACALCNSKCLENSEVVLSVLDAIYKCENTFERLILGALFGRKASQFLFGWKNDYETREESVNALKYFAFHTNVGQRRYKYYSPAISFKKNMVAFIDLPLDCCSNSSPLRIAARLGIPDLFLLLLQYGANPNPCDKSTTLIDDLLHDIGNGNGSDPKYLLCLKILMRAIPSVPLRKAFEWYNLHDMRKSFINRFPHVQEFNLIPDSRCAKRPPELKHLSRCCIRKQLTTNFQLPFGIQKLGISKELQNYLNLLYD